MRGKCSFTYNAILFQGRLKHEQLESSKKNGKNIKSKETQVDRQTDRPTKLKRVNRQTEALHTYQIIVNRGLHKMVEVSKRCICWEFATW